MFIKEFKQNDKLSVTFLRDGKERNTEVILESDLSYTISLQEKNGETLSKKILKAHQDWLKVE